VPKAVAILLVLQTAVAGIALFVLLDGVEWVCEHIRVIALSTVLIGGIVGIALTIPSTLAGGTFIAWGFIGLMAAACLSAVFIIARDFWKHPRRTIRPRYLSDQAEDEWLVFDGQVELGPFSTEELLERFSNGEIMPSDHVWRPGMDRWRPAYAAGLQRLAVQPDAIPLSNARNHPQALESGCPPSIGAVPPWMARSWTRRHPERTWGRERRAVSLWKQVLQGAPQLGDSERLQERRNIMERPLGALDVPGHECKGDVSIREDLGDGQHVVQAKLNIEQRAIKGRRGSNSGRLR
jgi:hypothetical protein